MLIAIEPSEIKVLSVKKEAGSWKRLGAGGGQVEIGRQRFGRQFVQQRAVHRLPPFVQFDRFGRLHRRVSAHPEPPDGHSVIFIWETSNFFVVTRKWRNEEMWLYVTGAFPED